jgi:hypothetical protein
MDFFSKTYPKLSIVKKKCGFRTKDLVNCQKTTLQMNEGRRKEG